MYVYGKNVAKEILSKKQKINKALLYNNFSDNHVILFWQFLESKRHLFNFTTYSF